jgi:hypothetical protein
VSAHLDRDTCVNAFCIYLTDGAMVGDIGMHSIDSAIPQQSLVEVNSPSNDLMPQEDLFATFNDPLAPDKDAYSISNNTACAELEFVILPHTAHVYFRVLWEVRPHLYLH